MNILNMNYETGADSKMSRADGQKTLRIVLLTRALTLGGAQRQLVYLARGYTLARMIETTEGHLYGCQTT